MFYEFYAMATPKSTQPAAYWRRLRDNVDVSRSLRIMDVFSPAAYLAY
ncbi:MAG: hypothetical protein J6X44_05765 [Thermoguttaceae bacterium]|nr:hypothetical protein [Thermoguttaceae bacterium]